MARPIVVRADWDAEAEVWVAGSPDLPALITEAESIEALRVKLRVMIPELLELGGVVGAGDMPIEILAYARDMVDMGSAA